MLPTMQPAPYRRSMETTDLTAAERFAAGALFVAAAAGLAAMAFHPTGHDLLHGPDAGAAALRTRLVHGLAIAGLWLQATGLLAVTRRLQRPSVGLAELAGLAQLLAAVAGTIAAMASGFVAPRLAAAVPPLPDLWHANGLQNRVFAQLFVVAGSAAMTLWSLGGARGALPRWLAGLGLVLGATAVVLVASGLLRLSVHGMGAVVLLQTVWQVAVAVWLWQPMPR